MSKKVLDRLKAQFGDRILATSDFRGDEEAIVAPKDWLAVARFLYDDSELQMIQFVDLTCVDYPLREPELPRFDVVVMCRSLTKGLRVRVKTRVRDGEDLDSLFSVWKGADWTEREAFDMFGVKFKGHPDLRRVLMYDEFEGYPLRKDYPIERTQPLVQYRQVDGIEKIAPFGKEEGQPYNRIDWLARMNGRNLQVSPAIALQQAQRDALSQSTENES